VQRCRNLERELGLDSLWVKRDDLTSPLYGGNKVRKLEFILAHARGKGCRKVLAIGGVGSNHCVANAVFCREMQLRPLAALVDQPITEHVRENLLLDLYLGNEILYAHGTPGIVAKILWKYAQAPSTYLMMPGGSTPLGTLGFVNAALELKEQVARGEIPEPDHLFVACGSAGTAAGLALGVTLAGLRTRIHAVQVSFPVFSAERALHRTARWAWQLLAKHEKGLPRLTLDHLIPDPDYYGGLYGKTTPEGRQAVTLMRQAEGIGLETTYTGKTFAALCGFARVRREELRGKTLLYWHTYNGRDFSSELRGLDYHDLPQRLHWVFESPVEGG
jgi:D-cysteine desulfhydrase